MSVWNEFWSSVHELFTIPIGWDFYTVLLLIIFILTALGGYFLISRQIKLVKAEVFSFSDYLKCVIYGLLFASGIIIIIDMMFIFAINTPKMGFPPSKGDFSDFLLWPVAYLMIFLLAFPLVDLLYMAHSKENKGLTTFEELVADRILHKFDRSTSYLIAILLYLGFFIVIPGLLIFVAGLPFIIIFLTFASAWPIIIINHFGVRGYTAGLVNSYYHFPVLSRSVFLAFDKSNRLSKEFIDNPVPRIWYGLQVFLYVWTWISLIQTVSVMFAGKLVINTMGASWSVFIVLIFGITGYFTRFWGRKIKFRWMDILLASWLIASVGINVLITFLIANSAKLDWTFLHWSITAPITYSNFFQAGDFILFVPGAIFPQITIITYITYYLLGFNAPTFKNNFYSKAKFSGVDVAANKFDPIPMFNLIRVSQGKIRDHAKEELIKMYSRIPYRKEIDLTSWKYMDPLFDAISDYNINSNEVGIAILEDFLKNHPKLIMPKVIEAVKDYNYDKRLNVASAILAHYESVLNYLPIEMIYLLLNDKDYHIRRIGIKLLLNYPQNADNSKHQRENNKMISSLLNDPDYEVQADTLKFVSDMKIEVDPEILFKKLIHPNKKIKSSAALSIANLGDFEDKKSSKNMIKELIKMLNNPDWAIRGSIITALTKIGNFQKYKIPFEPFLDGISDTHKQVRDASELALKKYLLDRHSKDTKSIFEDLIDRVKKSEVSVQLTIFKILEDIWEINTNDLIPILIDNLKSPNKEIQQTISKTLVKISDQKAKSIIFSLLQMEEEVTYVKRGIVSETIAKICENNPKKIEDLISFIKDQSERVRINVASSLTALAGSKGNQVNMKKVIQALTTDPSNKVKKELMKFIISLSENYPDIVANEVNDILKMLDDKDDTIRLSVLKMLIPLSKIAPIPYNTIKKLVNDTDPFVRESAIQILANIGSMNINESFSLLKDLLNDPEWNVKNAAIEAIQQLGIAGESNEINNKIIELLNDKEKWTRMKAIEILSEVMKKNPNILQITKIKQLIQDSDPEIRRLTGKIIGSLNSERFEEIFPMILSLMSDSDKKVRESASSALVSISASISMKKLLPLTLKYFSDETDMRIQQSMALALKRIVKYESKEIKNRLIDILKIRCEMSQDPIICQVLQDLVNG